MSDPNSDPWTTHYRNRASFLYYPDENLVRMLAAMPPRETVLDLGCGSGRHAPLLARYFQHYVGADYADISPMIEAGKSLCSERNRAFVRADARNLPFATALFDAVVAWGSLYYGNLDDVRSIIREIYRVLKNKGYFFGTLRDDRDTHLERIRIHGPECEIIAGPLAGARMCFVSENDIQNILGADFAYRYGVMRRSPLGEPDRRICHFFFEARKRK